jgi:membrane-associated phospholipid phosphatase
MRPHETLLVVYFAYVAAIGFWLPVASDIRVWTLAGNAALVGFLAWLSRFGNLWVRDWIALPLMLLGYKEMGWFATPHADTRLEEAWIVWDRALLNEWHGRAIIESLGPVFPSILELAYPLVYTIGVFCLTTIYLRGDRRRAGSFLFCLLLGTYLSYALFPFFPSEPPRTVFPGADMPSYQLIFRRFNHWLLGNWGIHTSVFPSAHVSSAFAGAFGMYQLYGRDRMTGGVFVLASLIAVSTVYGRYHYLVDAVAGIGLAVVAWQLSRIAGRRGYL